MYTDNTRNDPIRDAYNFWCPLHVLVTFRETTLIFSTGEQLHKCFLGIPMDILMSVNARTRLPHLYGHQGWGRLFELQAIAVVCSCEASVCSCNRSCICGCLKPSFAVVLAVVRGLKSPLRLQLHLSIINVLSYPELSLPPPSGSQWNSRASYGVWPRWVYPDMSGVASVESLMPPSCSDRVIDPVITIALCA